MAYYFVDNFEASADVVNKLQDCSMYFPVPQTVDGDELKRKIEILSVLHATWTNNTEDVYSYQSEVYRQICEMFSKNVFHDIPPASYALEDEINAEMMWEFKQLDPVYMAFAAFLDLEEFDGEKLAPYADETFVDALIRRLHRSCMEAERHRVKRILFLLIEKAPHSREHVLRGTVSSLARSGHSASVVGGINELLELFNAFVRYKTVESSTIFKVLCPLIERNGLCHYADMLHECFETAAREVDVDLAARFVGHAIDRWPAAATAAAVPSLCRTLAALYFDACTPERRRRGVRSRVAGHVVGRLVTAVEAGRADATAAAACRAYAEFCGRLIDEAAGGVSEAAGGGCGGRDGDMELVAEGLMAVHRTGRDGGGAEYAGRSLRRLIAPDGRGRCLVGADCRVAVMGALLESRSSRSVFENQLVDTTF